MIKILLAVICLLLFVMLFLLVRRFRLETMRNGLKLMLARAMSEAEALEARLTGEEEEFAVAELQAGIDSASASLAALRRISGWVALFLILFTVWFVIETH